MEQPKLDRINELARKSRETGLTEKETAEQQALRQEYIAGYRQSLKIQLDSVILEDENGNRTKLAETAKPSKNEKI